MAVRHLSFARLHRIPFGAAAGIASLLSNFAGRTQQSEEPDFPATKSPDLSWPQLWNAVRTTDPV
jgi:hypothetical protein